MPLLSERGYRQQLRNYVAFDYTERDDPTFFETMQAAYGFIKDENRSISSTFNNQAYYERRHTVEKLKNRGMNLKKYIRRNGSFNYDKFSADTGLVKTNKQIYDERVQMLADRRARSQDVMDRGSGFATFLGMGSSYMADPINLATLPLGGVGATAKGLSILGRTMIGARNMAGVSLATELAIQPLVYSHKQSIDSPYTTSDAIQAIGITTLTAGILGGGVQGVAGYLAKSAEKTAKYLSVREGPFPTVKAWQPSIIEGNTASIPTAKNIKIVKDKLIQEEIDNLTVLSKKSIRAKELRALQAKQKYLINKQNKELDKLAVKKKKTAGEKKKVAEIKGKYRKELQAVKRKIDIAEKANAARTKLENFKQGRVPELNAKVQKELDDWIQQNSKPATEAVYTIEKVAENLKLQKGFRAEEVALEAFEGFANGTIKSIDKARQIAIQSLRDKLKTLDADSSSAKEVDSLIAKLEATDDPEAVFNDLFKANIEKDLRILENNESIREAIETYTVKPEDYMPKAKMTAPKANTTGLQDAALSEAGFTKAYNEEISIYNTLENKRLIELDEKGNHVLVSADDVIKAIDDDLEGLESIMRCSRV